MDISSLFTIKLRLILCRQTCGGDRSLQLLLQEHCLKQPCSPQEMTRQERGSKKNPTSTSGRTLLPFANATSTPPATPQLVTTRREWCSGGRFMRSLPLPGASDEHTAHHVGTMAGCWLHLKVLVLTNAQSNNISLSLADCWCGDHTTISIAGSSAHSICQLCLREDADIHIHRTKSLQSHFQASSSPALDVVSGNTNWYCVVWVGGGNSSSTAVATRRWVWGWWIRWWQCHWGGVRWVWGWWVRWWQGHWGAHNIIVVPGRGTKRRHQGRALDAMSPIARPSSFGGAPSAAGMMSPEEALFQNSGVRTWSGIEYTRRGLVALFASVGSSPCNGEVLAGRQFLLLQRVLDAVYSLDPGPTHHPHNCRCRHRCCHYETQYQHNLGRWQHICQWWCGEDDNCRITQQGPPKWSL